MCCPSSLSQSSVASGGIWWNVEQCRSARDRQREMIPACLLASSPQHINTPQSPYSPPTIEPMSYVSKNPKVLRMRFLKPVIIICLQVLWNEHVIPPPGVLLFIEVTPILNRWPGTGEGEARGSSPLSPICSFARKSFYTNLQNIFAVIPAQDQRFFLTADLGKCNCGLESVTHWLTSFLSPLKLQQVVLWPISIPSFDRKHVFQCTALCPSKIARLIFPVTQ